MTSAATRMPPHEMEEVSVFIEPEPKEVVDEVITEQVTGMSEDQRPEAQVSSINIVVEQPQRSDPVPNRCVCVSVCGNAYSPSILSSYFPSFFIILFGSSLIGWSQLKKYTRQSLPGCLQSQWWRPVEESTEEEQQCQK